jgi:hypothetical protein
VGIFAVVLMLGSLHVTERISKRQDLKEGWRIVMVDKVFAETGGRAGCIRNQTPRMSDIRHSFFERITKTKNEG